MGSSFICQIPRKPAALTGELWSITTYFNPAGYSNKLEHLRIFSETIRKQGVKLLIVELAFGEASHVLEESQADRIIRVRSSSILWQKERLLNIAIEELPDVCDKVVWIDADILFENDGWIEETNELLQEYVVVQPFHKVWYLPLDCQERPSCDSMPDSGGSDMAYGTAYRYVQNSGQHPSQLKMAGATGHAWAARRSLLKAHGLYDRSILGGGDAVAAIAMFGYFRLERVRNRIITYSSQAQLIDILNWMERLYADVKGSVFYAERSIFHLWHGTRENRQYETRHVILQEADFDPHADISLDRNRCWQWSSEKPELHRRVWEYFGSRKEQDVAQPAEE
jgi:hypothetical protein